MSGLYNATYFANRPEIASSPGILYCVVLVNKTTQEREVMKLGIAKGKTFKDAIRRSNGFKGYEMRIQKLYCSTLFDVWEKEQYLHQKWKHLKKAPKVHFAGHTECFEVSSEILLDFPKNNS